MTREKLLFCYDHFYPGFKAGGPIQSLVNLSLILEDRCDVFVICSSKDLGDKEKYGNISENSWNAVKLPGSKKEIMVWYAKDNALNKDTFNKLVNEIKPRFVYLNGIFSYRYFLVPLMALRRNKNSVRTIICPRGMLQRGALAMKSSKKKLYLTYLKLSGLLKGTAWHATNEEEADDIKRVFGDQKEIVIIPNVPRKPVENISLPDKKNGSFRLVYLSLIAAKKNLLQLLEIVAATGSDITLDIYGPVKDLEYWNKCELKIASNPGKFSYRGNVTPDKVQDVFSTYDAGVLLTRGENFGHAIYECLSAGRPVITSFFTPWNDLTSRQAGWNVDIGNSQSIQDLFVGLSKLDKNIYQTYCEGAFKLSKEYYFMHPFEQQYLEMFGTQKQEV